jgi:hypothetical protein
MNGKRFARWMSSKRSLLSLLASSALLTTGCSNMMTSAPSAVPQSSGGSLSGNIHGGSQPVAFATVTLYYASQSGIGAGDPSGGANGAPIVAATTTSADDGRGSFSFSKNSVNDQPSSGNQFSCPSSDPLVYVVARGGNTLNNHDPSVNNTAAAFLAVFGLCSQINSSSFVAMTEATTVASMVAMQQYFNPFTGSFGADGIAIAKQAIVNTVGTISNLVDVSKGTAITSKTVTGTGSVAVTVAPQTQKINALANIIASCINNASASATPCTTLFSNATPPDPAVTPRPYKTGPFPQATDVLQALYYMLSNPTNGSTTNRQNIYNLIPAVGTAFQPTLTAMPSDWTVSVTYSSTATCGSSSGGFINKPQELNIDRYGNVWIANGQDTTGNLSAISSAGSPIACASLGGGARGGGVIDTAGYSWYASRSANKVVRYDPNSQATLEFTTAAPPLAIFADGGNGSGDTVSNIYFTTDTGTALYMIPHGASASVATSPIQISSVVGPNPARVMVDMSQAIWVSSGSNFVSRVAPGTSGDANYLNGYSTTQFSTTTDTYGVAVNSLGVNISSTNTNSSFSHLSGSGTSYSVDSGWPTPVGFSGLSNPLGFAIDGRSNIWAANTTPNSVTGLASLSEVSGLGTALFPSGTEAGGLQLDSTYLSVGRSIVIDQSGNVWIANEGPSGTPGNFLTEIVGGAVPIYQPFSLGLTNERFQTIP